MRASYTWLKEVSTVDAPASDYAEKLTAAGIEVEAMHAFGGGLDGVVVAEVRGARPHPARDKLSLVTLSDGTITHEVVCGAPNVPAAGGRVLFAQVGTTLPNGLAIGERSIGGVVSRGMICSEVELGIGPDASGIIVLGDSDGGAPGSRAAAALGLDETIFEIGLTPNRPDCLGHIGLAREVALLFGTRFQSHDLLSVGRVPDLAGDPPARVEIADVDRCPRYGAAVVLDVAVAPSPLWLRYRLHCLGLRPIHNVVDITNLVLLEHGHPVHAFDLDRLRGERIVVRRARDGDRMRTLDGTERTFVDDDLLICDAEGPVAVAGVMGGENSEIAEATKRVLVEVAYFDPRSVRRTARRLGLHTDASHRFERGVDPNGVRVVLPRVVELIRSLSPSARHVSTLDVYPKPLEPRRVQLRHAHLGRLLGVEVPPRDVPPILEGIGCEITPENDFVLEARVPTARPDITREVDLIEEVARVRGYDLIPTDVPSVRPSTEGTPRLLRFLRRLRELGAAAGLEEAINYAFVSAKELEAARATGDVVPLANPLSDERAVLRTTLLAGLAADLRRARHHQVARVALFELARTFHARAGAKLPDQPYRLDLLLAGPRPSWVGDGEDYDFFDAKGAVEAIVRPAIGVSPTTELDAELERDAPYLHPRRRARVRAGGTAIGVVGELHPDVVEALDLRTRAAYASLDVAALLDAQDRVGPPQARALPRFPAAVRDLAVVVPEELASGEVRTVLRGAAGALVEDVVLFDVYRGNPVPVSKKSLAFRVIYRDPAGTLTDARVDEAHASLVRAAGERFGASLR